MSGVTPRWAIPYPTLTPDTPDAKAAIQNLALSLDDIAKEFTGTLGARPAAAVKGRYYFATDNGILYRDSGASWDRVDRPGGGIPHVDLANFPPSSPFDGQEINLDPGQARSQTWHLRYKSSNGYWYVVGTPETASTADLNQSTSSGSYVSLGTDPSVVVPLSGDYLVGIGSWIYAGDYHGYMSWSDGVNPASDSDSIAGHIYGSPGQPYATSSRWMYRTLVGGRTLTAMYRSATAGLSASYQARWMRLIPVRVH